MRKTIAGCVLELVQGSIENPGETVGAIVNAANSGLRGGSGVDGAIHARAGSELMEETRRRYSDGCATGSAVATAAYGLDADYVFHAVGPIWSGGHENEEQLLASAHRRCLELALKHDVARIHFPAISTGVYGFPVDRAARVALGTVHDFLLEHKAPAHVCFVLFTSEVLDTFTAALREIP